MYGIEHIIPYMTERYNMKEPFKLDMYFMIRYYAKKHSKTITRRAKWDENCRQWTSQKGDLCLCYYDVDAPTGNKYRTAVNYEVLA